MITRNFKRSMIAVAVAAALVGVYAETGVPGLSQARAAAAAAPNAAIAAVPPFAAPSQAGFPDFASIVRAYGPAVVNIAVTGKTQKAATSEDDPMSEFFRRFGPGFPRAPQQGPRTQRGVGSGFIVASDGVILTNAHVVDGADEVTVKLTDRREYRAKVLGVDKRSDIAVLKIDAKNLPTVRIGDSSAASVGEWVLAIGSPFGLENTASSGIISAKSRALPDDGYVPFIQTDVAVNPGNSGGPLFNLKGEVIGINSQIYSSSGGSQGLSFAIPIDVASKVKDQLIAHGKVTRGRIGVVIQEVNQGLADSFGLKKPQGALVSALEKGGPAEQAGLEPGDVILRVDGREIDRSTDLPAQIGDMKPGTRARLEIVRKGTGKTLDVTIGEMKDVKTAAADREGAAEGRLGLAVRPLDADEARQSGIRGGLVVPSTCSAEAWSRLPVGSSATISAGSVTSARAMAARCSCPPDICRGKCVARSARPTSSSA